MKTLFVTNWMALGQETSALQEGAQGSFELVLGTKETHEKCHVYYVSKQDKCFNMGSEL